MKFLSPNFLAVEYFHSVHSAIFATRCFFRGGGLVFFMLWNIFSLHFHIILISQKTQTFQLIS